MKVIISGGGTGGHIFPAIAIADALKAKDPEAEILFVGALGKMEMKKVPEAGYPIIGLPVRGLQRKLTWKNVLLPARIVQSLVKARKILKEFRPDAVVGVGGYASGPVLYAATGMKIPTLIQEQNSVAGMTNKLLAGRANRICVAFEGMETQFPIDKLRLLGNPVRKDIGNLKGKRKEALTFFGLDQNKKTVFVFGGSLGARTLNEAMTNATAHIGEQKEAQFLWQTGSLYADEFAKSATAGLANVQPLAFVNRMDLAYAMADLVICRAGALTLAELGIAGKAAILVPSPNVVADHQRSNARALVSKGAAVMIEDAQAKEKLIPKALELLNDSATLKAMSAEMEKTAFPDAADRIATEVIELANGKKSI